MADEIEHHGISGMHWGHRKGTSGETSSKPSGMFGTHHMTQKVGTYDKEKIKKERIFVAKTLVGLYAGLSVLSAVQHFSENPIRIHIDYTRPPFKKAVEPYFKATIKKIVPKLLPGS